MLTTPITSVRAPSDNVRERRRQVAILLFDAVIFPLQPASGGKYLATALFSVFARNLTIQCYVVDYAEEMRRSVHASCYTPGMKILRRILAVILAGILAVPAGLAAQTPATPRAGSHSRSGQRAAWRAHRCDSGRSEAEPRGVRHQREYPGRAGIVWPEPGAAFHSRLERQAHHHGGGICAVAGGDALMDHQRRGRGRGGLRRRAARRHDHPRRGRPYYQCAAIPVPGARHARPSPSPRQIRPTTPPAPPPSAMTALELLAEQVEQSGVRISGRRPGRRRQLFSRRALRRGLGLGRPAVGLRRAGLRAHLQRQLGEADHSG